MQSSVKSCSRAYFTGERNEKRAKTANLHVSGQWRILAHLLCNSVMQSRYRFHFTIAATLTGFEPVLPP